VPRSHRPKRRPAGGTESVRVFSTRAARSRSHRELPQMLFLQLKVATRASLRPAEKVQQPSCRPGIQARSLSILQVAILDPPQECAAEDCTMPGPTHAYPEYARTSVWSMAVSARPIPPSPGPPIPSCRGTCGEWPIALKPIISRESRTRQPSGTGCAGALLGPGTVAGSQGQIQRCGVVQRPGVAAAIVTESEDGGEFQYDVGIG
jgi:hypothetical protein